MPPFVSKVLASPAVRKAALALLLAVLAAAGFSLTGCAGGQLDPKSQRALDTFECYVKVLSPYVGEVCDTAELVRDVVQGRVDLARTLILLGSAPGEVAAVVAELEECRPQAPVPQLNLEAM